LHTTRAGFPTIKHFGEDKTAPPVDYSGAREAAPIVAYAQAALGAPGAGGSLVSSLTYLGTHTFLWGAGTPTVVLLTQGGAKTAPAWLTSLAVKFKDGKVKRVAFGHARADEEPAIAARFGVTTFPALVALVPTGGSGEGYAVAFDKPIPEKPAAALREIKEFVEGVVAGDTPQAARAAPPAFPAPDVPRKLADVAYAPLSEDNLHSACFGGKKGICVLALVRAPGGEFAEAAALTELARKYRNGKPQREMGRTHVHVHVHSHATCADWCLHPHTPDPFSFVWLDAPSQPEFAAALGVDAAAVPSVVVVKHGKRPRMAAHAGPITASSLTPFLDRVLGGDVAFSAVKALPELVPDALRDALNSADEETAAEL
jgi:hypothetical protein